MHDDCESDGRAVRDRATDDGSPASCFVTADSGNDNAFRVLDASGLALLGATIERDIIPRLLLASRAPADPSARMVDRPTADDVALLSDLLIGAADEAADAYVRTVRRRGVALEAVLTGLLAPAARRLGEMWETDQCTFMEVTVGLFRLQRIMARITVETENAAECAMRDERVLLTVAPGEQHTFGLLMFQEFLRQDGFEVHCALSGDPKETFSELRGSGFAVLGISVATPEGLVRVPGFIQDARRNCDRGDLFVICGGGALQRSEITQKFLGCDAIGLDERDGIRKVRAQLRPGQASLGRAAGDLAASAKSRRSEVGKR